MSTVEEKRERFNLLVRRVELPDEIVKGTVGHGYIEKVEVARQAKTWTLHLCFPAMISLQAYRQLTHRIQACFRHIADTRIVIHYEKKVHTETLIEEYWEDLVQHVAEASTYAARVLEKARRKVEGDYVTLYVHGPAIEMARKKKVDELVTTYFRRVASQTIRVFFQSEEVSLDIEQRYEAQKQEEEQQLVEEALKQRETARKEEGEGSAVSKIAIGYEIDDEPVPIQSISEEERRMTVQGEVFRTELRELRSGRTLLLFNLTDYTDSIQVKLFIREKEDAHLASFVKDGMWVKVRGSVQHDTFARELVIMANDLEQIDPLLTKRLDTAPDKRVEWHAHTTMSAMDGLCRPEKLVERAAEWGHRAVAITDHDVVQAFPDVYYASKKYGIKVLYGVEANVVNDAVPIVVRPEPRPLKESEYVVFDVETTGLSVVDNTIIELAGVKMKDGKVVDRFETFVNPHQPIPEHIQKLTNITQEMVENAPELEDVIREFTEFVGDAVLVAHNARFDMGFLHAGCQRAGVPKLENPVLDTLELARLLYPNLKNHRLNTLAAKFNVSLENHHRAVDDSEATGYILFHMLNDAVEKKITHLHRLNDFVGQDVQNARPFHCTIYAKNETGKKNLYKLVSLAHTEYFHRVPRIPKSKLDEYRDGLLICSGCEKGELFETVLNKSLEEAEEVAEFYDVLEIQPSDIHLHLVDKQVVESEERLKEANRKIVKIGEKLNKPVIATGNVHYLDPEDKRYREMLIHGITGFSPLKKQRKPDVHFRTTDEMLEAFKYLGEEKALDVVVTQPNALVEQFEELEIIPDDLYTPKIEGAEDDIREMSYAKAKEIYGDPLPDIVEKRLEKELNSIISHGFAVIYLIAQKLVKKSLDDGYLVGSRGSVGSSFVATMLNITEVNPLPPHYLCPHCKKSEWFTKGEIGSGFDLEAKACPDCGHDMIGEGQDIPFETFLGFKGDKVPDIDLNFSGEYQPIAHEYTKELFGEDHVFRAGTISTVAEKTAFGFVKKYAEQFGHSWRNAEVSRLASGCTGVKRTTGQHPGGIIVVPDDMEIYDFCPIQYPADDKQSKWRTTHYDFHSIHDNLLKLDILGHDDPTVIRMLQDLTGVDPKQIPLNDPKVMELFRSTDSLGVTPDEIGSNTGTLGIPEFGTRFVRQMLEDTRPNTFAELVQISGLSHGTDVWLNNAQELIRSNTAQLSEVISTRDDIMTYLIHKGMEPSLAFNIMESVRKGRGLKPEWKEAMREHGVPEWYIESCLKIKYMFPKAHAAAYVMMAVRIAYFKVYYPIEFYAAYFTVRADDFDVEVAVRGYDAIHEEIERIEKKGLDASPKEKNLLTILELAREMTARGFTFSNVDLYRSDAAKFLVDGNSLLPPFSAIAGVGVSAAQNIVKAREEGEFLSVEDLQQRSRASRNVMETLEEHGCLEGLPLSNQLSLF